VPRCRLTLAGPAICLRAQLVSSLQVYVIIGLGLRLVLGLGLVFATGIERLAILATAGLLVNFGVSYQCFNFGENRSRNATVKVHTDGYTDAHTQTCPTLYAIAMGQ